MKIENMLQGFSCVSFLLKPPWFKLKLSLIVSFGKLLIDFFHRYCFMSTKYNLVGNQCVIIYTTNS